MTPQAIPLSGSDTACFTEHSLSSAQHQILFHCDLYPEDWSYHVPWHARLRGPLDHAHLEEALRAVVGRHASLRTRFVKCGDRRVARVFEEPVVKVEHYDLRALPERRRGPVAGRAVEDAITRPFALAQDPAIRASVLRVGDEEHLFVLTTHHVAVDGWSLGVIVRELARAYSALQRGLAIDLPPCAQALDFLRVNEARHEKDLAYWRQELSGAAFEIDLPADRPRPRLASWSGAHRYVRIEPAIVEEVTALARASRVTPFTILLAAFQILVARLTGLESFLIAVPSANRISKRLEAVVGTFVNVLPIRARLDVKTTARDALLRASRALSDGLAHAAVPFGDIVRDVNPPRSRARQPLCQLMFQMELDPDHAATFAGLTAEPLPMENHRTRVDLFISLWEHRGALEGFWEYATDLFDESTVDAFIRDYEHLLHGLCAEPDAMVMDLARDA